MRSSRALEAYRLRTGGGLIAWLSRHQGTFRDHLTLHTYTSHLGAHLGCRSEYACLSRYLHAIRVIFERNLLSPRTHLHCACDDRSVYLQRPSEHSWSSRQEVKDIIESGTISGASQTQFRWLHCLMGSLGIVCTLAARLLLSCLIQW